MRNHAIGVIDVLRENVRGVRGKVSYTDHPASRNAEKMKNVLNYWKDEVYPPTKLLLSIGF